ncbi:MAG: hypothetical protein AAGC55_23605, partial [Myxococcota bacterium]
ALLDALPIPLVRLPTTALHDPWWLVLIAHEMGHHLEFAFELNTWLRQTVRTAIAAVAGPDETDQWVSWSSELFADAVAIHLAGTTIVTALSELLLGPRRDMLRPVRGYPMGLLRVRVLERMAGDLGLTLTPLDAGHIATLEPYEHFFGDDRLEAISGIMRGTLADLGVTLAQLTGFDPDRQSAAVAAARGAIALGEAAPDSDLQRARILCCAGFAAWLDRRSDRDAVTALASHLVDVVQHSGPPGERAQGDSAVDDSALADALVRAVAEDDLGDSRPGSEESR